MSKLMFLVVMMFCLGTVSALEISATSDTNVIVKDVGSVIKLTLKISNATNGSYNVYTLSDIALTPSEVFEIPEGFITKEFILTPLDNLDVEGPYTFTYTLNHRDVEKIDKKFTANLLNLEDVIEIGSEEINSSSNEISFYVKNKEDVYLKGLSAKFSSLLFDVEKTFDLEPFEKKIIKVVVDGFKLKKTKAGVYIISGVFDTNKGGKEIKGNLYLGEKKGIVVTEDSSGFLIKTYTISKINTGNVFESVEIDIEKNIISRLFTNFNIEPTFTERSGFIVKYVWTRDRLGPTEVLTVKSETNYILPLFFIIVLLIVIFGFKRFRESKLVLNKSVKYVKTKGGEFALKVTLSLKASKAISNVTLIDKIPIAVKVYEKFGMVKPDKIDPESRRLHWHIGNLNAGEERIFNYIVYSKVGFVGKFALPEAVAVFEKEDKIHEVNSNQVFFMSDQVSE
ncbi:MAG: hypothetical protein NUV97_00170 [archaeon]|nr:hypothetical protein [archaeon]MCR4323593.1 hypothetical protein [Nanoarchaeota archaeon]